LFELGAATFHKSAAVCFPVEERVDAVAVPFAGFPAAIVPETRFILQAKPVFVLGVEMHTCLQSYQDEDSLA
jgi:hypothetical protein